MLSNLKEYDAYKQAVESSIIVSVGLLMHLYRISIIEVQYSRLPLLTPNAASSLFVFSILCIFSKLRPLWPQTLRRPKQMLVFLIELALILYATDFLVRQVWLPSLKLLNFLCHFTGQYIIVANRSFLDNNAPRVSHWIRNDGFYMARFLLAVVAFIFMLDTTGVAEFIQDTIKKNGKKSALLNHPLDTDEQDNVNEFPHAPQEDLLNVGHHVGAKRRRLSPARKSKRKAANTAYTFNLDDNHNEYHC